MPSPVASRPDRSSPTGGLDLLLTVVAAALVAVSFLPWYRNTAVGFVDNGATAWASSTGWSIAVVLGVSSAAGWLLRHRITRSAASSRALAWVLPAAAALSVVVAVWTWLGIPPTDATGALGGTVTMTMTSVDELPTEAVRRDDLWAREDNVAYGYFLGVGLMAALTLLLGVASLRASRSR